MQQLLVSAKTLLNDVDLRKFSCNLKNVLENCMAWRSNHLRSISFFDPSSKFQISIRTDVCPFPVYRKSTLKIKAGSVYNTHTFEEKREKTHFIFPPPPPPFLFDVCVRIFIMHCLRESERKRKRERKKKREWEEEWGMRDQNVSCSVYVKPLQCAQQTIAIFWYILHCGL